MLPSVRSLPAGGDNSEPAPKKPRNGLLTETEFIEEYPVCLFDYLKKSFISLFLRLFVGCCSCLFVGCVV